MNRPLVTTGLVLAVVLQVGVLVGMVVQAAAPLWTGTEIRVETVPVDPRSMFRGNYARLNYEFSSLLEDTLSEFLGLRAGEVVYTVLEPDEENIYRMTDVVLEPPAKGVFLRGRLRSEHAPLRVEYGIEAFFAPKEKALQLQRDLSGGGVALLMVTAGGRVTLKDVVPHQSAEQAFPATTVVPDVDR